jgi:acetate kinase
MVGVDCIIFTGGIGENSSFVRELICRDLHLFGIQLDPSKNNKGLGSEEKIGFITATSSSCRVAIVKTDEELVIARETAKLVLGHKGMTCCPLHKF